MIFLEQDSLCFRFAGVHPDVRLDIDFQRTLRIPDDEKSYPLPPGLGRFPLRHVDDFAERLPKRWLEHGGILLPMYQSEALWLSFSSPMVDQRASYPFLIKIATGKINAITGEDWDDAPRFSTQDYVVAPIQPWLDGYCIEKGTIRQFVAMPLGSGYSAEEQLTGEGEWGGLQILVHPMKWEAFQARYPKEATRFLRSDMDDTALGMVPCAAPDMGLAPGGRMRQEISEDPYEEREWDLSQRSRCFVHIANSMVWSAITGEAPLSPPLTAKEYTRHGFPWFDYYADSPAVEGGSAFSRLKSILGLAQDKKDNPLPENDSVEVENLIGLHAPLEKGQVREW